jgi:heat-inducible transcriptional repressor
MTLTDRRAAILSFVVDDYIDNAEPVSSRALVDRHRLRVSSATIRNELARLEEDGYVTHPYTSAGRIPAERGYRHYVEALMSEQPVGEDEKRTIEHQFHQVESGLDDWLTLAATVLAGAVDNAAVVTRPHNRSCRLKHLQLVHLQNESALLVAVMDDGRVQQRILSLPEPATQDELTQRAERLNNRLADQDASEVRLAAENMSDREDSEIAAAVSVLIEEHRAADEAFLQGLRAVLEQPEFASADRMLDAVEVLEAYRLQRLLDSAQDIEIGSTRVLIGSEHGDESMHDWSIVVSAYGAHDNVGTVAVLGPTRMRYDRTIPRVRYFAALMSDIVADIGA